MTAPHRPTPANPTPEVVEAVLTPLSINELLRIHTILIENPRRHATRILICERILRSKGAQSLYDGPQGPACAARDHALYLATTHGIEPFRTDPKYGHMYATDVDDDNVVTYKAASHFRYTS